jgi:hypothetical protein
MDIVRLRGNLTKVFISLSAPQFIDKKGSIMGPFLVVYGGITRFAHEPWVEAPKKKSKCRASPLSISHCCRFGK